MKALRTLTLAALALAAGACGTTPTEGVRTADGPAFDGGGSYGSGHRAGDFTAATASAGETAEAAPADTTGTALRGGGSYGSGH